MRDSERALRVLSQTQLDFISAEFGITKPQILEMDDGEFLDLYDNICDIEIDETILAEQERNGAYSERERMAEGIVTVLGNELYRPDEEEDNLSEE